MRFTGPSPGSKVVLASCFLGLVVLFSLPPRSYTQDLQAPFLAAWALRDGLDYFTPLNELSERYLAVQTGKFPHPTPHPPFMAFLSLPLTLVPFTVAAPAWLAANLLMLRKIGRSMGLSSTAIFAVGVWLPLFFVVRLGQLEVLLLFLTLQAWRSAAVHRDNRAGFLLGLAAALKLYPILLLLPFVWRRRWDVVGSALATMAVAQLVNVALLGPTALYRFYTEILPDVSAQFLTSGLSASPYSALSFMLGGADDVAPILDAPWLAAPIAGIISLVALVIMARSPLRVGLLALIVALPMAWYYYAVWALPAVVGLVRRLSGGRLVAAIVAFGCMSFNLPAINLLILALGLDQGSGLLPSPVGMLYAIHPLGAMVLLGLAVESYGQSSYRPEESAPAER